MDRARRARVEALFEGALQIEPPEREAWLRREVKGDATLAAQVRNLLAAHDATGGLLDHGVAEFASRLAERSRPPVPIGPYRILEEVGRGGMSVVFRAERSDGAFRRKVAIKVLRAELDADDLHTRLSAERQILASLDHPGIAHLLDGGRTEDGRPYLVMEFVEGRPLTHHCDEARLGVQDRLRLFLEVTDAVQHAHARLVVHRDLKPSNILVTEEGRVRLLDFGIAKVLDLEQLQIEASEMPVTRAGSRLLTPEYASPEQLQGKAATTANDVWALGVLLHELLTGRRPFDPEKGSQAELEDRILHHEPIAPSAVALRIGESEAARRASTPGVLSRRLSGDLDRIVAMALGKDPQDRYPSVEKLAEDIRNHLAGRPVHAQPNRLGYRMRKFLVRHRIEAAVAALLLAGILVGAGGSLWMAREAHLERDRADLAAQRAEQAAEYLIDLFRVADPWEVPVDRLTARELLNRGLERLEGLPDDPVLRSRIALAMGEIYLSLGDGVSARPLLDDALEFRERTLGPLHPETGLARLRLAELLRREGRFEEAERLALDALAAGRGPAGSDVTPQDILLTASALDLLGFVHTGMSRLADAEADFRDELELLRAHQLEDRAELGSVLVNLAAVHRRQGRPGDAETLLREALEHRRRTLGESHPLTAVALARLGGLLLDHLGRPDEAEAAFAEALAIQSEAFGLDHPARAEALGGLAAVFEGRGETEQAEALLREATRILLAGLGEDHPLALAGVEALAGHLRRGGRLDEAEPLLGQAILTRRATLGDRHPTLAGALGGWGAVLLALGRDHEAEEAFREALRIREDLFGADHPLVALSLMELASVYEFRQEESAWREALESALTILERAHPADHPEVLRARALLGRTQSGG